MRPFLDNADVIRLVASLELVTAGFSILSFGSTDPQARATNPRFTGLWRMERSFEDGARKAPSLTGNRWPQSPRKLALQKQKRPGD
jgi:hypothetical protein